MADVNQQEHNPALGKLRIMILGILAFGMVGTVSELLFMGHDESLSQIVPIVLIAMALIVLIWHLTSATPSSLLALRLLMGGLVVSGVLGVVLHSMGSVEFQKEIEPTISGFDLFKKVIAAKAPPALAPGIMAQLGLLGLAYTYRHPAERKNK